jgi:hypothetical protein
MNTPDGCSLGGYFGCEIKAGAAAMVVLEMVQNGAVAEYTTNWCKLPDTPTHVALQLSFTAPVRAVIRIVLETAVHEPALAATESTGTCVIAPTGARPMDLASGLYLEGVQADWRL